MDQPAARQRAYRCRSRDGALRARGSGARLRRLLRPRADDRPEQGQRRPSHGDGVPARGRARPTSGLAREEDARRDRLSRAARRLGNRRRPAARGGARLPPIKFPGALDLSVIGEDCRAWGGLRVGGIATVATAIGADLAARLPRQNKKQREGLALLVATALDVRDVNLMELAAALPRAAARLDMRYQWISRLLANALIDTDAVIAPFAREVLARAGADGRTLVLIIDQSQINTEHQMVMVSLRVGGRALPLAWRVKKTSGAIGFAEQRAALDRVAALLPAGVRPVLMGDRFYGSPALIAWCRAQGWDWRLRLKQDLLVFEAGGETTLADCFTRGEHLLRDLELTEQRVRTTVAMVHEAGHPEPWIIALSQTPSVHTAFDYGLRWGIEAMVSDVKTRGFNREDSQIARTDRLDRLVLVLALALHWAGSTGMWDAVENRTPVEKRLRVRNAGMSRAA